MMQVEVTKDAFWRGKVSLFQPARGQGYRTTLDPVLLAGFALPGRHVLDLGAGNGILGVLLLAAAKAEQVSAVEVQPTLAELARRNAEANGFGERMAVFEGDARALVLPRVDTVVCNPPYFRQGEGNASPNEGRDAARRERNGTLAELVRAAAGALADRGAWFSITPYEREDDLHAALLAVGLHPVRRRYVVGREGRAPGHVLLEAQRGAEPLRDEPPLIVHGPHGYTAELERLLSGP